MGRASLKVHRNTALGIVTPESALPPAHALLDHRQARFALQLMARPSGGGGQEEILDRTSGLTYRMRERCGPSRRETVEVQIWEEFRSPRGGVFVESREDALRTAREWQDLSGTVWTDGSELGNGRVGAALTF